MAPSLNNEPVPGAAVLDAPTVTARIDNKTVEVPDGTTVLAAARSAGIRIPTLCEHPDLSPAAACRLCLVEVDGQRLPQAACAYPLTDGAQIDTYSPRIAEARKHIVELLLSEHVGDCRTCKRNGSCELQDLAAEYGITSYRFGERTEPVRKLDLFGPSVLRDMDLCVLCTRCVRTCEEIQGLSALGVLGRGDNAVVSTYMDRSLAQVDCVNCGQCINRCPTGALTAVDATDEVWAAIKDPSKHVVIQTAPAPRSAIGEEFGQEPGTPMTWQMNTALRKLGFDRVFDMNFSADLTIMEEGTELLLRLHRALVQGEQGVQLPMFTSCSPGWVKFIETTFPDMLAHLSSAKSPQQMFGALLKTWYPVLNGLDPKNIVSVSLIPCTAKKFECERPEMTDSGFADVDIALTTRELAKMIREAGIWLPDMDTSDFDDPFGTASGSGVIFGVTGGVMESALRTVLDVVTGGKVDELFPHFDITPVRGFEGSRVAEVTIPNEVGEVPPMLRDRIDNWDWLKGVTLRVGVVHGIGNARKVLDDIRAGGQFSTCHFIEFMACPGGCLGGGGQPIPTSAAIRTARASVLYGEDAAYGETGRARVSDRNTAIVEVYNRFLTDGPCQGLSHQLLHTTYSSRHALLEVD